MKKILLLAFFSIFSIFCAVVFTASCIEYCDFAFIIPCLVSYFAIILLSYQLIVEMFLGHKTYTYDDASLYIWRKGKIRKCIQKENVSKIILTLDVFSEELYLISFMYEDKKYYVSINKDNEMDILNFIDGKDFTKHKNWWYYLIMLFSH